MQHTAGALMATRGPMPRRSRTLKTLRCPTRPPCPGAASPRNAARRTGTQRLPQAAEADRSNPATNSTPRWRSAPG